MSDRILEETVPRELAGERLDRVLAALVPDRSKAALQKLVRRGGVRIDGVRVLRSNVRMRGGQTVRVELEAARQKRPERTARPEPTALPTLGFVFEDEHIVVVDKPAGLAMHPAERVSGTTVVTLVEDRLGPLPAPDAPERAGVVHRLDRETSGLVVLGRTVPAMRALQDQFRARSVAKRYVAIVHGAPREARWTTDVPIGPAPGQVDRQRAHPPRGAKEARTAFELTESLRGASVLTCRPHSGRRHQIRVHLLANELQLVGERIYRVRGRPELPAGAALPGRHALHAANLEIAHPQSGERMVFESALPADLEALRTSLTGQAPGHCPTPLARPAPPD